MSGGVQHETALAVASDHSKAAVAEAHGLELRNGFNLFTRKKGAVSRVSRGRGAELVADDEATAARLDAVGCNDYIGSEGVTLEGGDCTGLGVLRLAQFSSAETTVAPLSVGAPCRAYARATPTWMVWMADTHTMGDTLGEQDLARRAVGLLLRGKADELALQVVAVGKDSGNTGLSHRVNVTVHPERVGLSEPC